ncbi:MAG: GMP synthase [Methanomicrobiales archaeon HGW-Methanomicrobiales-1]|jgi:GMP synthase-like glutamine amidotransferase|nr:MAG: GMP synthase [Methanomicrobiales archaeon HGW-Methanomicrobiales-1]
MTGEQEHPIRVRAFQHTPSEPLGFFEQIFTEHNVPFEYTRLWEGDRVSMDGATHLIFLGGPMSVNDEQELPWLKAEKELIRRAVKKRVPVLGLCLGAQLIASAHGATVYRFVNETGWYPVHTTPDATSVFSSFPDTFRVFQMHGETFHLPVRARLQCRGDQVPHQGFRLGSALGLQFHLEMTGDLIRDWIKNERTFLRQKIGHDTERYLAESNRLCRQVAGEFLYGNVRKTR